jgi:NAD(P)H-flavin reductase
MNQPYLPAEAQVIERVQECRGVFTLSLGLTDTQARARYALAPGQLHRVYLYGVGEVPISIVSDPEDAHLLDHTIRALGRVTRGLEALEAKDRRRVRGPYGRGWPLIEGEGRDVVLVTGGLGCAPVVSVINYILRRRERFGRLVVMQGVKHAHDLIWREKYEQWAHLPHTQVLLASDEGALSWPYLSGGGGHGAARSGGDRLGGGHGDDVWAGAHDAGLGL